MRNEISAQELKSIIHDMPNMIGYWDRNLRCRFANNVYSQWFDKPPSEIIGLSFQELAGEQLFTLNEPHIRKVLAGEQQRFERTLTKVNGEIGHIIGNYIPDIDDDGTVRGFSILANEVTDLKETAAELQLAACVFDNMSDGVLITDVDGIILSVNPAFTKITGYAATEVVGSPPRILQSNRYSKAFYASVWREIKTKSEWSGEIWNRRKDGTLYLERMSIRMIRNQDDEPIRYISIFNDITELWRNDEKIKHMAFHDALTNLPNRTLLMERLDQRIINYERQRCNLALMFIDLDGFKAINDQFGHKAGDDVLKEVAKRLLAQVRKSDTVARVGGDEFIFILNAPKGKDEITHVVNRIISSLNKPVEIFGEALQIGTSIGISIFPDDGLTSIDLINHADRAMYVAKSAGENNVCFFSSDQMLAQKSAATLSE